MSLSAHHFHNFGECKMFIMFLIFICYFFIYSTDASRPHYIGVLNARNKAEEFMIM